MGRSGYTDDCDNWALIRWRGAVKQSIGGQRGQAVLRELVQALDALPEKRLGSQSLVTTDGDYCTLGALGLARGINLELIDSDDREAVARAFGVAEALAAEIMWLNDEMYPNLGCTAEVRWEHMRAWLVENLKTPKCE